MTKRVKQKKPTGGARPGAGRPRTNRRIVSARIDNTRYSELRRMADTQGVPVSKLIESMIESMLEKKFRKRK